LMGDVVDGEAEAEVGAVVEELCNSVKKGSTTFEALGVQIKNVQSTSNSNEQDKGTLV
jgi:hypothetical protein